ncbi:dienelactone hydrolase family protein [Rhizobium giardinii]|uniref:Dienelactone hydrolase n=1 Tax=Rhizobium giardinii TaxID=56731 RepID=A0A7W8UHP1_9HYPH|nr:dienelactone hydrolase family protein [Rhizobium giardinii]MBB5539004.1 dienelactone hydrolase [Rhizobium giardinii]
MHGNSLMPLWNMTAPSEGLLPFLAERIATNRYPLAIREPFGEWQKELRGIWRGGLPPSSAIRSEVLEDQGTLRRLRFHYPTGDCGEAVLMLPQWHAPHAAVLLMHDHGGVFDIGWRKMVSCEAGKAHAERHYDGRFLADDLVRQGYAVLICDALGWGSRFAGGYEEQQALAAQVMQAGWSLAGLVAADDLAAFDWLGRQPEIDPTRVGTLGFSFGGFRAWQLAALEQRVRACAALSWAGTKQDLLAAGATLLKGQSAFYTLHPHLAVLADFPNMAALAADRPLFMRTGSDDRHFQAKSAQHFFAVVEKAAGTIGMQPDLGIFLGAHSFPKDTQRLMANFFKRHLA